MRIDGFVWLPDIVGKIEVKHHLDQDEVEQVFFNRPQYWFVERGYSAGRGCLCGRGTDRCREVYNRILHLEEERFRFDRERARHGRTRAKTP